MTVVVWLYSKGNGEVMSTIIESAFFKKKGILHFFNRIFRFFVGNFFTFGHCILYGTWYVSKTDSLLTYNLICPDLLPLNEL